jgi:hypothetical protein
MNHERSTQGNGVTREPPRRISMAEGSNRQPLGNVARDVMDHISMLVRDEAKIARLSVRRYTEHVREDVAPKALFGVGAAVCAGLAVVCGLLALFLAIAWALGSVAWTFLIFCGLFVVGTIVMVGLVARPRPARPEDISKRFPAVGTRTGMPEHALARQSTPEGHREVTLEAERETSREMLTPHTAVVSAEDQARRMGAVDGERREIAPRHDGEAVPTRRQPMP